MKTKHEQVIITTSDLSEMKGKFLAERLRRSWKEDFVDEESGEVVSIERHELLFEMGTLLDPNTITEINFMLQSGDISEVKVSDQERACVRYFGQTSLWETQILLNQKKKKLFLYANTVELAKEIASDYIEQTYTGHFDFIQFKKLDYCNVIYEDLAESEKELDVYKMEVTVAENDGDSNDQFFILQGNDAEECKQKISDFIRKNRLAHNGDLEFDITIISAKTIPCDYLVDPEFCKKYLEINQ